MGKGTVKVLDNQSVQFSFQCNNPMCVYPGGRKQTSSQGFRNDKEKEEAIKKFKSRSKPWCRRCNNKLAGKKKRDPIKVEVTFNCSLCGKEIEAKYSGIEVHCKDVETWNSNSYKCAKGCHV